MNGIHDLGGLDGFGPVVRDPDAPVFHAPWERAVFAMFFGTVRTGLVDIDTFRHAIERMPPGRYLAASYYERWLWALERTLGDQGAVPAEVLEARRRALAEGAPRPAPADDPALTRRIRERIERGRSSTEIPIAEPARFRPGDRVRARNLNPAGHTRLPRYARGRAGKIARWRGSFVFPDTNAHGRGANPQHLYSVRFAGGELWGDDADTATAVYLDLWDSYLEPA